jgi:hypothetical protein
MSKGGNILANCFKKSTKNTKDFLPQTAKTENLREEIPIKFPETSEHIYSADNSPNILFEEWPSDDILNSFDFTNNGQKFTDPSSNLIIFPYSLRKETYSSMIWMRPEECASQKNLIELIKAKFEQKNYNFIKNKIELAQNNLLNFEIKIPDSEKQEDNLVNTNNEKKDETNNTNNNNTNENNEQNENQTIFNSLNNMNVKIKRRNSIDIANAEGECSNLKNEFYSSKLTIEEKNILLENQNKKFEFVVVPFEEDLTQPKEETTTKPKGKNEPPPIHYHILKPSNLNLAVPLCDYSRWVSSQFQILLDNKINCDNNEKNFLRKIYPQDKNGVPIYNPSGKYWVKLYHMGKYRKIEIDDRFPVNKETYDYFFPQCSSPLELWPLIFTKALIKLYSYKYKTDNYEYFEIGDSSILYSLTKYIGIKLTQDTFLKYLSDIQEKKIQKNEPDEIDNNNNYDNIILSQNNTNQNGYDLIIAYISSRNFFQDNFRDNQKIDSTINEKNENNFPLIKSPNNLIGYFNKIYKIPDISANLFKIRKKKKNSQKPPPDYQLLFDSMIKNTTISTKKELSVQKNYRNYLYEHRFLTNDNLYKNYQKYTTLKTNKIHQSCIICDVGYTLLEIFQSGNFNMKRLKPIYFGDMKLNIKVKYKQMSPDEKAIYLEQIKELKKKQKVEKENRTNEYLDQGSNCLCLKITNESINKDNKKVFEIDTLYNIKEIEAAKFCKKNNLEFPPVNYFEGTFIEKATRDEETGEINFWTKKFYLKLLKNYFKKEEELISQQKNVLNEGGEKKEADEKKIEEKEKEEIGNEEKNELKMNFFQIFEEKSSNFTENLDQTLANTKPGTWLRYENFKECFNNFILFKNMEQFKNKFSVDNIWYNYDKDIYEEKENSNIIHLIYNNTNNENCDIGFNNILKESDLYIIFEPNSEKNRRSVSAELPYEINEETKKGNQFNDIHFSISLILYEINPTDKKVTKLSTYIMTEYFCSLNINISKLSKDKNTKEYFINIKKGICPFGYHLQFLSNFFTIENYSHAQFLCEYKGFIEKKINIIHPILPKDQFYLMKTFLIEHKKAKDENEKALVRFMTNYIGYDDNVIKQNIDVVLINSITNKKVKIYYNKIFEVDFKKCDKYRIELSIISPWNIPERNFDYLVLYDNPNISIDIFENITPFYIRQKYLPNKHNILLNELIFPSDTITTTFDISLEYRPAPSDNQEQEKEPDKKTNNISNLDENLPPEKPFPCKVRIYFYFSIGQQLIFKKDFENQSLFRNLVLQPKPITNPKDVNESNQLILNAYSIKCVIDKEQSPSWLIDLKEYKGDVYWKISVFSTDALVFVKNTIKEDKEKEVMESWEIKEPGRKAKAELSRRKYFVNIKYKNGEVLSPEEETLIKDKIERRDIIESNSAMLVTNIPPREKNPTPKVQEVKKNDEILYKLPKIKNYRSLFMKNFYMYSNQSRVITKKKMDFNPNINSRCESLPNINIFCKTPQQRQQEMKDIEDKFEKYYEDFKKEGEKNELEKNQYNTIIQDMNERLMGVRKRLNNTSRKEMGNNLNDIIKKNNNMLVKLKEIQYLYDDIFAEKKDDNFADDVIFDWYSNFKAIHRDIKENKINLHTKYMIFLDEIKKKLGEIVQKKYNIVKSPESKSKPELIKKYKDIIEENIIDLNIEEQNNCK